MENQSSLVELEETNTSESPKTQDEDQNKKIDLRNDSFPMPKKRNNFTKLIFSLIFNIVGLLLVFVLLSTFFSTSSSTIVHLLLAKSESYRNSKELYTRVEDSLTAFLNLSRKCSDNLELVWKTKNFFKDENNKNSELDYFHLWKEKYYLGNNGINAAISFKPQSPQNNSKYFGYAIEYGDCYFFYQNKSDTLYSLRCDSFSGKPNTNVSEAHYSVDHFDATKRPYFVYLMEECKRESGCFIPVFASYGKSKTIQTSGYGNKIYDGDEVLGIVISEMNLDYFNQFLENMDIYNGNVFIIEKNGYLLGKSDSSFYLQEETKITDLDFYGDYFKNFFNTHNLNSSNIIIENNNSVNTSLYLINGNNLIQMKKFELENLELYVLIIQDYWYYYKYIEMSIMFSIIIFFGLTMFLGVIGMMYSFFLHYPVYNLKKNLRKICTLNLEEVNFMGDSWYFSEFVEIIHYLKITVNLLKEFKKYFPSSFLDKLEKTKNLVNNNNYGLKKLFSFQSKNKIMDISGFLSPRRKERSNSINSSLSSFDQELENDISETESENFIDKMRNFFQSSFFKLRNVTILSISFEFGPKKMEDYTIDDILRSISTIFEIIGKNVSNKKNGGLNLFENGKHIKLFFFVEEEKEDDYILNSKNSCYSAMHIRNEFQQEKQEMKNGNGRIKFENLDVYLSIYSKKAIIGTVDFEERKQFTVVDNDYKDQKIESKITKLSKKLKCGIVCDEKSIKCIDEKRVFSRKIKVDEDGRKYYNLIKEKKTEELEWIYELKYNEDHAWIENHNKSFEIYEAIINGNLPRNKINKAKKLIEKVRSDFPEDLPAKWLEKKIKKIIGLLKKNNIIQL